MKECIVYLRKSTEDKKGLSIPGQKNVALELAEKNGLKIINTYSEEKSALHVGRPEFLDLMNDMHSGKASYIVCWHLNRLARNMVDGGALIDALQNKVIKGIVTSQKIYLPDHPVYEMLLEFGVANQFSRDLSVNVKRGNFEKLKQGGWPNKAPVGYLNNKVEFTIELDSQRAPLVRKMFETYATGQYSLQQLSDIMFEAGLTSRPGKKFKGGNKIRKSKIQLILSNPFYYGLMQYKGKLYPGNHKPLITQNLFEQCQIVMSGKSKSRKQKHSFVYRGLCTCAECGCLITAEKQRGHSYYHCTNGKNICRQKSQYLRGNALEEIVLDRVLSKLHIKDNMVDLMYKVALEKSHTEIEFKQKYSKSVEREIQALELKLSRLTDMLLDSRIEKHLFDQKKAEIENNRQNQLLRLENANKGSNTISTIEQTRNLFKTLTVAKNQYLRLPDDKKRDYLFKVLSNIALKDKKIANFQYKSPYDLIAKTPKKNDFAKLWALWHEVRTFIEKGGEISPLK